MSILWNDGGMEPSLFRHYPALAGRLPREPFVPEPTPVTPLPLAGVAEGALWAKRDERSSPHYGGNKPRKLEFVLGHARALGARRLVTTGGIGTHHGLATTILGRAAGMETTLVLVDQPLTDAVRRNVARLDAWGAELVFAGDVPRTALHTVRVLARSALRGERPYLVATGGSSLRGDAGFVSAGLELGEQVKAGALPEPAELYVAVGTGGTLAGLVAGLRLAGLATRVVGVLVTDILPPSPAALARAARRSVARLHRLAPAIAPLEVRPADFDLARDQLGDGYGAPTAAGLEAVAAAREAGLELETTYTGKCLAEIRARAAAGTLRRPALFWNTYNAVDVDAAAPRSHDPGRLPAPLRRRLG
jgi:D-cysteine desulfhydrase